LPARTRGSSRRAAVVEVQKWITTRRAGDVS
jgi:hypothetical protein